MVLIVGRAEAEEGRGERMARLRLSEDPLKKVIGQRRKMTEWVYCSGGLD